MIPPQVVLLVVLRSPEVVLCKLPCFTKPLIFVEREKGFEPSTSTLARWHSTTELLPQTPWPVPDRGACRLARRPSHCQRAPQNRVLLEITARSFVWGYLLKGVG